MEPTSTRLSLLARQPLTAMPTRLQIERWAPMVIGCVCTLTWWALDGQISYFFAKELLAALLSAAAIAAGFLTTALSILLPISSTDVGRRLKRSGYLPDLYNYLRRALYSCLLLAITCVIAFFQLRENISVETLVACLLVFMSSYSAAALVRIAEVLMNLFELASEPENKDG